MAFTPFTKDERPTMKAFNEKFMSAMDDATKQAVEQSLAKGGIIEYGSYVGDGNTSKTLTFGFTPVIFFLPESGAANTISGGIPWIRGHDRGFSHLTYSSSNSRLSVTRCNLDWGDEYLTLSGGANTAKTEYPYVVIGVPINP